MGVGRPHLQREIFGPILPVIEVESEDEAIEFINARFVCYPGSSDVALNETLVITPSHYMCSPRILHLRRKVCRNSAELPVQLY
jgi:hypothetical protein